MVQKLIKSGLSKTRQRRPPENHVGLKPGDGWQERNFLAEILIPSLFTKRIATSTYRPVPEITGNQIGITWIGHASFLIQTREHNVLIDPNWAKWLKIVKRLRQPGLELHQLPQIDLVLVTHAHFDHLDRKSLRAVASNQPIVVPENVGNLVHDLGFDRVHELQRWQSYELGKLRVTLTPAFHWGARMLHDSHRGFGGFHLEYEGRTLFHCGDSAYFPGFTEIGERLQTEIALLPIGAYDAPSKRDVHMNPEQALQAFVELRARTIIPMHYGTFRLSYEPLHEPPERLLSRAQELGLAERVRILTEGETILF